MCWILLVASVRLLCVDHDRPQLTVKRGTECGSGNVSIHASTTGLDGETMGIITVFDVPVFVLGKDEPNSIVNGDFSSGTGLAPWTQWTWDGTFEASRTTEVSFSGAACAMMQGFGCVFSVSVLLSYRCLRYAPAPTRRAGHCWLMLMIHLMTLFLC